MISDGHLQWQERPDPIPGHGQLLVRVEAAGVNGADILQRAGRYPPPAGIPEDQPGLELAGTVESAGPGTTRFRIGDKIMSLTGGAAQAERAVVPEMLAMPVPASVGLPGAGGIPEAFATAYDALFTRAGLALGERVLVTGAAGGVGVAAVQLAVSAGARVVASAREERAHPSLESLGAEVATPDEAVRRGPFDVVLELVGAPSLGQALPELAPCGRIAVIGTGAGGRLELDLHTIMSKRAVLTGSTLRARPLEEKALVARALEQHVLPLLEAGRLQVPIEATFPMSDAQAAYDRFAAGSKFGKIILTSP